MTDPDPATRLRHAAATALRGDLPDALREPLAFWLIAGADFADECTRTHGRLPQAAVANLHYQLAVADAILGEVTR